MPSNALSTERLAQERRTI